MELLVQCRSSIPKPEWDPNIHWLEMEAAHSGFWFVQWQGQHEKQDGACHEGGETPASSNSKISSGHWLSHAEILLCTLQLNAACHWHYQDDRLDYRLCSLSLPQLFHLSTAIASTETGRFWDLAMNHKQTDHCRPQSSQFWCKWQSHIAILDH